MFQKWRPLVKSLSSSRSNLEAASSIFHPSLSFSSNIYRPPHFFPSPPVCSDLLQDVHRSRSASNSNLQISKPRCRSPCFRCGMRGHFAKKCNLPPRCFLCGSTGHKSNSCPDLVKRKLEQSNLTRKGCEDDSWMLIPIRGETSKSMDCFLLDPDVVAGFDPRVLQAESRGPPVQQVIDDASGFEKREGSMQGGLCFRGPKFFPGSSRFVRRLGPIRGIGLSWNSRSRQGPKHHCSMGIGKNHAFEMVLGKLPSFQSETKSGISIWDFLGKGCKNVEGGYPDPQAATNRIKSLHNTLSPKEPYPVLEVSDLDAVSKNNLPPAPLDVISNINILDDFEDCCSEDVQESFSPQVINMEQCVDGFVMKKKGISSKKMLGTGAPISVRRSPRFASI